jgi:hypothetical protein
MPRASPESGRTRVAIIVATLGSGPAPSGKVAGEELSRCLQSAGMAVPWRRRRFSPKLEGSRSEHAVKLQPATKAVHIARYACGVVPTTPSGRVVTVSDRVAVGVRQHLRVAERQRVLVPFFAAAAKFGSRSSASRAACSRC